MKRIRTNLTQERLRALLSYDAATGVFRWLQRPSTRVKIGQVAGTVRKDGYRLIRIDGQYWLAQRLAWLYVRGEHPKGEIDHRDRDRGNNCILNLRDIPGKRQQQNMSLRKDSSTGFSGVDRRPSGRYRAQIVVDGKAKSLGCYDTPEEAHARYIEEKSRVHPFAGT